MYHIYMCNNGDWCWFEGPYSAERANERVKELNDALNGRPDVFYTYEKWEPVPYESVLW